MDTTTTHPPTLAERLRGEATRSFGFRAWCDEHNLSPGSDEALDIWTDVGGDLGELLALTSHAADVLGLLAPYTIEMVERVLAEDLPDGWTATVSAYVVLTHNDGREFVASYCGEPLTERFTWWGACAPTDDDPDRQVSANTLAELIEAVTS